MAWMQKLCEVYDHAIAKPAAEGKKPLLPVGQIFKKIKYQVTLSAGGEFLEAKEIPEEDQLSAVPTTPQAEARTSTECAPFPLAEQCKYLFCMAGKENARFDRYLSQLKAWSESEHAPQCLRTLVTYLEKRTLYQDILKSGVKLKFHKDEQTQDGAGADSGSFLCFAVNDAPGETRLWKREDVHSSWTHYRNDHGGNPTLCYVTGEKFPVLESYPKVEGNAKLISAKDAEFRFQYRGRFTDAKQVTAISSLASAKAHNALRWLVERQGTKKYGMTAVAWDTDGGIIQVPGTIDYGDENEAEQEPDTFVGYGIALRDARTGHGNELLRFQQEPPAAAQERMKDVCILCMENATTGRISITYYQEIQGNDYVQRLSSWYAACKWPRPRKGQPDQAPTIRQIGDAVLGPNQVGAALGDFQCSKAATKLMRELNLRIIMCIAEGVALPEPYVRQAFRRAVAPLSFTDGKGSWQKQQWLECLATTCALIRKRKMDLGIPEEQVRPALNASITDRSYLYGRLAAVADVLEQRAAGIDGRGPGDKQPTNALRMMTQFVQRPYETWAKLHEKLLPSIMRLSDEQYQRRIGEIEALFTKDDRADHRALSELFLIGYYAQQQAMWKAAEWTNVQAVYAPSRQRDELFGCLLAIADVAEQKADPERVGKTNAVALTVAFASRPGDTWAILHDKLLPYLERLGQKRAWYYRNCIRQVEGCFDESERTIASPLSALYLHGYYGMRNALLYGKADGFPARGKRPDTASRESLYGALLAEEDRAERIVLDLIQRTAQEENRPSNALRFLSQAAKRPEEVWQYLRNRMRPYAQKLRFSHVMERADALHALLQEHGWNTDEPLNSSYLHYFYTTQHKED